MNTVSINTNQIVNTRLYNQSLSTTENLIKEKINYLLNDLNLNRLSDTCEEIIQSRKFSCAIYSRLDEAELFTELQIEDKRKLERYELNKDQTFLVKLSGYKGNFTVDLYQNVALEFALIYKIGNTLNKIVDVFDIGQNISSTQLISSLSSTFVLLPTSRNNSLVSFDINILNWLSRNGITNINTIDALYLLVTPRTIKDIYSVVLNLDSSIPDSLPYIVREFKARSSFRNRSQSPVIELLSQVTITEQYDSNFFYSILIEEGI